MKFGMFMMPSHPPGENPTLAFERDLQLIEHAERLGFDEVLIGEHHSGGWETVPAPDLMIAAASQRTQPNPPRNRSGEPAVPPSI